VAVRGISGREYFVSPPEYCDFDQSQSSYTENEPPTSAQGMPLCAACVPVPVLCVLCAAPSCCVCCGATHSPYLGSQDLCCVFLRLTQSSCSAVIILLIAPRLSKKGVLPLHMVFGFQPKNHEVRSGGSGQVRVAPQDGLVAPQDGLLAPQDRLLAHKNVSHGQCLGATARIGGADLSVAASGLDGVLYMLLPRIVAFSEALWYLRNSLNIYGTLHA